MILSANGTVENQFRLFQCLYFVRSTHCRRSTCTHRTSAVGRSHEPCAHSMLHIHIHADNGAAGTQTNETINNFDHCENCVLSVKYANNMQLNAQFKMRSVQFCAQLGCSVHREHTHQHSNQSKNRLFDTIFHFSPLLYDVFRCVPEQQLRMAMANCYTLFPI